MLSLAASYCLWLWHSFSLALALIVCGSRCLLLPHCLWLSLSMPLTVWQLCEQLQRILRQKCRTKSVPGLRVARGGSLQHRVSAAWPVQRQQGQWRRLRGSKGSGGDSEAARAVEVTQRQQGQWTHRLVRRLSQRIQQLQKPNSHHTAPQLQLSNSQHTATTATATGPAAAPRHCNVSAGVPSVQ